MLQRILTFEEQTQTLELIWNLVQKMELQYIKTKQKNKKERDLVLKIFNFLNKIGYTENRPGWEIPEDPRQLKMF